MVGQSLFVRQYECRETQTKAGSGVQFSDWDVCGDPRIPDEKVQSGLAPGSDIFQIDTGKTLRTTTLKGLGEKTPVSPGPKLHNIQSPGTVWCRISAFVLNLVLTELQCKPIQSGFLQKPFTQQFRGAAVPSPHQPYSMFKECGCTAGAGLGSSVCVRVRAERGEEMSAYN